MEDFNKNVLLNSIREQAKLFLEEFGTFYPFGYAIDNTSKIKPLAAYSENKPRLFQNLSSC